MNEQEFDQVLENVFKQDFSDGTETFRDALLERCLEELGADTDVVELTDDELDLLAAAGDSTLFTRTRIPGVDELR